MSQSSIYVVIDIGCYECDVSSEYVGRYLTKEAADAAAKARDTESGGWRDGGQSFAAVFEVPNASIGDSR